MHKNKLGGASYVKKSHAHAHDFIEIAYVSMGRGCHFINGKKYNISRGDIFIINYDTVHRFSPPDDDDTVELGIINCIFLPKFIENLNIEPNLLGEIINMFLYNSIYTDELAHSSDLTLSGDIMQNVNDIYNKMLYEYTNELPGYVGMLKSLLYNLLINLYRAYIVKVNNFNSMDKYKYDLVSEAVNYLKQNYSSKLNLEEICQQFFLSKSYFSKIFKSITGLSIFEYIQKIRIDEACKLLQNKSNKMLGISESVGYSDYGYFYRTFKRITGLSPMEYKRKFI